jgi:hypothetical protein
LLAEFGLEIAFLRKLSAAPPCRHCGGYTSSDDDGWSYEGGACSLAFEESWTTQAQCRDLLDQSVADRLAEAFGRKRHAYLPIMTYSWLF